VFPLCLTRLIKELSIMTYMKAHDKMEENTFMYLLVIAVDSPPPPHTKEQRKKTKRSTLIFYFL
jgi:hypothetical protein